MYESYWGLTESPFTGPREARWFYESPAHGEALARLYFCVEDRRRLALLAGPSGTGKTLLLDLLAEDIRRSQRQVVFVDLCGIDGRGLLWQVAAGMGLCPQPGAGRPELWLELMDTLAALRSSRLMTVLLFDHLDSAEPDCSRTIERLVRAAGGDCWLSVIVAGPESAFSPLESDLGVACDLWIDLPVLDRQQTPEYVLDLLTQAGCRREVFEPAALEAMHVRTRGVPQLINRLCDLSLLAGMTEEAPRIDASIVEAAAAELRLRSETSDRRRPALSRF